MISPPSTRRQWAILRAAITTFVLLSHCALGVITALALLLGTAGYIQVAAMAFNFAIAASVIGFYFHKIIRRDRLWEKTRNVCLFLALSLFSFIVALLFLARLPHSEAGGLSSDFASLGGSPAGNSAVVLILACCSFLLSLVGLAAALIGRYTDDARQPVRSPQRFNIFNSRPYPYLQEPPVSVSRQASFDWNTYRKGHFPNGRLFAPQDTCRQGQWTTIDLR